MKYEIIREIFNRCSGNQMRDVFVSNEDVADPEAYVRNMLVGDIESFETNVFSNGDIVIDVSVNGLRQRFSFSED